MVQVGGAAGLVAVVGAVLAILGVIGWSIAVLAAVVAVALRGAVPPHYGLRRSLRQPSPSRR